MNRKQFQELARIRLAEARVLLGAGHNSGAYYLSGYAAECGLKACIAKMTKRYEFPDKQRAQDSYTHNLNALIKVAGLEPDLKSTVLSDATFAAYWSVVKDWNESSRYEKIPGLRARDMIQAVSDSGHGVLTWITRHW